MQTNCQSLNGKVVLITGSAQRIGASFNRHLHAAGASVIIHYRQSLKEAKALCDELNSQRENTATLLQGDLANKNSYQQLISDSVQAFGRLDILVNNASSFFPTPIGNATDDDWNDLIASNLKAPFFLSQAANNELQKNRGVIVNMVDIHGQNPLAEHPVYCAAKAGLIMLTRSLAKEMAPHVRVNGIAPGSILWPEGASALNETKKTEILQHIALRRQGDPEDLAKTLLYLVSDQSSYVTGQIIQVDGGRSV